MDMIEPSLDHHFPCDRFQPFRPDRKLRGHRLLTIAISSPTYGATSVSEDQTSECCKSIAPRIVDFDKPRSTSKAGPHVAALDQRVFKTSVMVTTRNRFIISISS